MRITVLGRGNVGGGLADAWEGAGHRVTRLGHEGGDVSDAEVVLVAVPGRAIADALEIAAMRFIHFAEDDDAHVGGEGLVFDVVEIAQDDAEVVFAAVVLVFVAVERR